MNAAVAIIPPEDRPSEKGKWEMKELKPWHRQFCSLLAQGIDRQTIASILDITPEYVSMLSNQPLIQKYIREMCKFASIQLEAQFVEGVKVIGDVMANGSDKERLQAVRLNAELTHRIGSGSGVPNEVVDTTTRLAKLAEKLLALQTVPQLPPPVDGEFHEVTAEGKREEGNSEVSSNGQFPD